MFNLCDFFNPLTCFFIVIYERRVRSFVAIRDTNIFHASEQVALSNVILAVEQKFFSHMCSAKDVNIEIFFCLLLGRNYVTDPNVCLKFSL